MLAPSVERCGYHGVASVAGQDDDVDRRGVVGHTDSSVLGFVLAEEARQEECQHQMMTPKVDTFITGNTEEC